MRSTGLDRRLLYASRRFLRGSARFEHLRGRPARPRERRLRGPRGSKKHRRDRSKASGAASGTPSTRPWQAMGAWAAWVAVRPCAAWLEKRRGGAELAWLRRMLDCFQWDEGPEPRNFVYHGTHRVHGGPHAPYLAGRAEGPAVVAVQSSPGGNLLAFPSRLLLYRRSRIVRASSRRIRCPGPWGGLRDYVRRGRAYAPKFARPLPRSRKRPGAGGRRPNEAK